MTTRPASIPLLDADRDLARAVRDEQVADARQALVVQVHEIPAGPWRPRELYGANPPAMGRLVGARRPPGTTALAGLARDGLVERVPDGWLLRGDPAGALERRGRGTSLPRVDEDLEEISG